MSESNTYRIVTIPTLRNAQEPDAKTTALAEKFRELRLRALKISPDSFASKYEDELKRGLDQTLERLSNTKAIHFIAVKFPNGTGQSFNGDDDMERVVKGEWLGVIVLLGPQEDEDPATRPPGDPFVMMTAANREATMFEDNEIHTPTALHFHLNAMFVDPVARGGGLGLALINAAVRRAEREASKFNAGLRVTIAVYLSNVAAHKLYMKAGFKEVWRRPSKTKGPEEIAIDLEMSISAAP